MSKRLEQAWTNIHTKRLPKEVEILEDFRIALKDLDERLAKQEDRSLRAASAAQAALYVANRR